MTHGVLPIQRALISVSDKTKLVEFSAVLHQLGIQILSTGGSASLLKEAGIPVTLVSEITQFPELMEGRVKTLHPKIHGGILGKRDLHEKEAKTQNIDWIDLVVVNLYPLQETLERGADFDSIIENIDIGGTALLRAAAKNYPWVGAVSDPKDYDGILKELRSGGVSLATRKRLALKVFSKTAFYDALIAQYLRAETSLLEQEEWAFPLKRLEKLRYGENPHQSAALFKTHFGFGLAEASRLQGKALSYNNLVDAEAALQCIKAFQIPAAVIVKHANPCGVAIGSQIEEVYQKAFEADSQSAFGGILALNRPCSTRIAEHVSSIFMEVILAPSFDAEALNLFAKKPNLRILSLNENEQVLETFNTPWAFRAISGGLLIQNSDQLVLHPEDLECVTLKCPSSAELEELLFAWTLVKHLKSNAIAISRSGVSLSLSAGHVSRIAAVHFALQRVKGHLEGAVLASDAFFPFRDSIDALKGTGIKAVIQPGGSIRDAEVIAACNELGIAMMVTKNRCFYH